MIEMIEMTEFAKRRRGLMQKINPNSLIILAAAPVIMRNGNHEYLYRQNSDFYYLTGFEEPEAVMVLAPNRKKSPFILFNRPRDKAQEIWDGYRAGQKGARDIFHADEAYSIFELEKKLPELMEGCSEIHTPIGTDHHLDRILFNAVNQLRGKIRSGAQSPIAFFDITPTIHEMRLIKSKNEIELMRRAAEISAKAHIRAMRFCKPKINEFQLEAEISHEFQIHGARFPAYSTIVGSHENSCTLHYVFNNQSIKNGSMVLVDAGCEYQYYASDVTRTFPANGKFSSEQKAVYDIVLAAQLAGIKAVKPGAPWTIVQDVILKIITQGLVDLGLLKGNVSSLIEQEAYFPFYMHRSGHWLGLDTHDVGRYRVDGKWRQFQAGMVLTVEPGIYISSSIPGVHKRWHHIGVRIEDDIVVTEKGNDVLSKDAPKTISDIETIMTK